MTWNWQLADWPEFRWPKDLLNEVEGQFLLNGGVVIGRMEGLAGADQALVNLEILSSEAYTTSEIEGEILDRASVQSSIKRQLGLGADQKILPEAEEGIAEAMVDLYSRGGESLDEKSLFRWHEMICRGRSDLAVIGGYRTHKNPMQIVSGRVDKPKVHFEAPPSSQLALEMKQFFHWYRATANGAKNQLAPVTRAAVAHLYFESIHPFEDGNGRIGRAISEQILMEGLGRSCVVGISTAVQAKQSEYYQLLEATNQSLAISEWVQWFGLRVLEAQRSTLSLVGFVLEKARFIERFEGRWNERQRKAILRMFAAGPAGFKGGLSASNYIRITRAKTATVTRDLRGLVEMGALIRTGERRYARYHLNLQDQSNRKR